MTSVARTIADAVRFYWRHGRLLLLASCLLIIPVKAITLFYASMRQLAPWAGSPNMATATQVILTVVDLFAFMFGCGAVTLLCADIQTGGAGSWRDAWSRALRRASAISRAYLGSYVILFVVTAAAAFTIRTFQLASGALGWGIGMAELLWGVLLFISPLFALIDPVASIEGEGGFAAVGRSLGLLKGAFVRMVVPLWLLSAPVPLVDPLFQALLPGCPATAELLGSLISLAVGPLISVATLSLYREARARLEGYTDAQLRADLDTI